MVWAKKIHRCQRWVVFLCLCWLFLVTNAIGQVILTEIMYDPAGNDNWDEFIEIYNTSLTDSVDLTGWQISDSTSSDEIVAVGSGLILKPRQFGLVLDADYFTSSMLYDSLLSPATLILTIDGKTFGQRGLVKSRPLWVQLLDATGVIVSARKYTLDEAKGHSEEKISLDGDNSDANWKSSLTLHGTPGFANSVTPSALDLALIDMRTIPAAPRAHEDIQIEIQVKNTGLQAVENFSVTIYEDLDENGLGEPSERLIDPIASPQAIAPDQTLVLSGFLGQLNPGRHLLLLVLDLADDRPENNILPKVVWIGYLRGHLLLSELMYYPAGQDEPEWVEIFNPGPDAINLRSWYLGDNSKSVPISAGDVFLPGRHYAVIAADSTFFSYYPAISAPVIIPATDLPKFNNTTPDQVRLSDPALNVIDSLEYKSTWGGRNSFTLERKRFDRATTSPANWGTSRQPGGTPGARNSIAPAEKDLCFGTSPPVFEPVLPGPDQEIRYSLWVVNIGVLDWNGFSLKLYDDFNRDSIGQAPELLDSVFYSDHYLNADDSVFINNSLAPLRSGPHRLVFQLNPDDNPSNNIKLADIVVQFSVGALLISEFMYLPDSDKPEWVELYNPGPDSVNISGWLLADSSVSHRTLITPEPIIVLPEQYLVIAEDSSFFQVFTDFQGSWVVPKGSWPSLNNSKDAVVIYDLCGKLIDRVVYDSKMGGGQNVSLERLFYHQSGLIRENWHSSRHPAGATPGRPNSVQAAEYDLALRPELFSYRVDSSATGSAIEFFFTVRNQGRQSIDRFNVGIYWDVDRDSMLADSDELLISQDFNLVPALAWNESQAFSLVWPEPLAGLNLIGLKLNLPNDGNPDNNSLLREIAIGLPKDVIGINEIMYYPLTGQVEWIELYNHSDQAINLRGYSLADASGEKQRITSQDAFLAAQQYAILAAGVFEVPIGGLILVPESGLPVLNNDQDRVYLFDAANSVIDSVFYHHRWNGRKGVSLERVRWERSAMDSSNWAGSCDSSGATPLRENCASPREQDIAFGAPARFWPEAPSQGDDVHFSFAVQNVGRQTLSQGQIRLYHDSNFDTLFSDAEQIDARDLDQAIESDSTVYLQLNWANVPAGNHALLAHLDFVDDDTSDNYQRFGFFVSYGPVPVLINEVMYSPFPNGAEWVELYNPNEFPVNLIHWQLSDADTANRMQITKNLILPAKEFLVLSDKPPDWQAFGVDSARGLVSGSFPSLANSGDKIFLFDSMNRLVDSLDYGKSVLTETGYSLERVSPWIASADVRNWAQSAARLGATPGQTNSLFVEKLPTEKKLTASPNPFSPNGDGYEEMTLISYTLPLATARLNLKIYDIRGRMVRFLCNNEPTGAKRDVPWDGKDDEGQACRMGIYILYLEAINADSGILETIKTTVVVAGNL